MIEVIRVWVSVVGLLFVITQLFIALRLFKGNVHNKIYDEIHKTHKPFVDYPELRPYFHHNARFDVEVLKEEAGRVAYLRSRSIAEIYYDVFEIVFIQISEQSSLMLKFVPFSSQTTLENWKAYISEMIRDSYFLASYLREVQHNIHPKDLQKWVNECINAHWPGEIFEEARNWKSAIVNKSFQATL